MQSSEQNRAVSTDKKKGEIFSQAKDSDPLSDLSVGLVWVLKAFAAKKVQVLETPRSYKIWILEEVKVGKLD